MNCAAFYIEGLLELNSVDGMLVNNSVAGGNGGAIYAVNPPLYGFGSPLEPLHITNCRAGQDGGALYLENRSTPPRARPGVPLVIQNNHAVRNGGGK